MPNAQSCSASSLERKSSRESFRVEHAINSWAGFGTTPNVGKKSVCAQAMAGTNAAPILPPGEAVGAAIEPEALQEREPQISAVRVVVRFRPLLAVDDQLADAPRAWGADPGTSCVESSDLQHRFNFDQAFTEAATQEDVYDDVGRPVVDDVLLGYHGTILAYGQTGSGKTYCMFGPCGQHGPDLQGVVPRAAQQVFDHAGSVVGGTKFVIECNFLEVYCEQLRDLLKPGSTKLQVKELPPKGCFIEGLTQKAVNSVNEVLQVLHAGLKQRAVANTRLNHHSSRSHAMFTLRVQQQTPGGTTKNGKLTLVDLAGSEKVHISCSEGIMLEQAKKINSSLSALGHVIDALADRRPHVPYRDSRLTRILEDSLGGNCRTALVVACSPSGTYFSETLSSLRFAARAKKVCNFARMNVSYACDRQLLGRIAQLRRELSKAHTELERRFCPDPDAPSAPQAGTSSLPKQRHSLSGGAMSRSWTKDTIEQNLPNGESVRGITRTYSTGDSSHGGTVTPETSRSIVPPRLFSSPSGSSLNSIPHRPPTKGSNGAVCCPRNHELTPSDRQKPWFCHGCGRISSQSQMECFRCTTCNYNLCDHCHNGRTSESEHAQRPVLSAGASREDTVDLERAEHSTNAGRIDRLLSATLGSSSGAGSVAHSAISTNCQTLRSASGTPLLLRGGMSGSDAADSTGRRMSWLVEATPLNHRNNMQQCPAIPDIGSPEDSVGSVQSLQMRLELERHRCASLSLELEQRTQESNHLARRLEDAEFRAGTQTIVLPPASVLRQTSTITSPILPLGGSVSIPMVPPMVALPLGGSAFVPAARSTQGIPQRGSSGQIRPSIGASASRTSTASPLRAPVSLQRAMRGALVTPRVKSLPSSARGSNGSLLGQHVYTPTAGLPGRSMSPGSLRTGSPRGVPRTPRSIISQTGATSRKLSGTSPCAESPLVRNAPRF